MKGRLLSFLLMGAMFTAAFSGISHGQGTETIYIGVGDYYALGPYHPWESGDLWVNMTVLQGGNVDLYVMSTTQYSNAYSYYEQESPGGIAFKSSSEENVSQANIYIHIEADIESENWMEDEVWVVVDNRDVSATPYDAVPTGDVRVELEVDWYSGDYSYDDFFWIDILFLLGAIAPFILLVIVIVIVLRMDRKNKQNPPYQMPYYQSYPPPVQPPVGQASNVPPPAAQEPPEEK